MSEIVESKAWTKYYGAVPESIDYPRVTLADAIEQTVESGPDTIAWDFFGKRATYRRFWAEIEQCSRALAALGLKPGDRITIAMPTSPQGVVCLYAAIRLGAVCSMIHPLSTPKEIAFYLELSKSTMALTLDAFYPSFEKAMVDRPVDTLILARLQDYLPFPANWLFKLTKGRKIKRVPPNPSLRWWHQIMTEEHPSIEPHHGDTDDLAVILYSGGTTGTPKGIMLSHRNFIAEGMQAAAWGGIQSGDSILAILPIFHGFGLGVCVNTVLMCGGTTILVPRFTPATVAKLIQKKRPNFIVGVPTLYDALTRDPRFQHTDLSCIRGAFCGADTLPRVVKERFEEILSQNGSKTKLLEGYGLTEAVTAIMCMPYTEYREGSIGVPWPDMRAKIVKLGTVEEAPVGEEGEICIHGPAVMLGYLDRPDETAHTLRTHADGRVWLHTGDIGTMDEDGFFYFKLREKRLIKSSGMNVYPTQVEEVLRQHPAVDQVCVIGIPDLAQVERVKAFVVPAPGHRPSDTLAGELISHCRESLIKWSCPREVEFRENLPKTLVGKIDFKTLQNQEMERLREADEYAGD